VPSGYRAPSRPGAGYRLVTRTRTPAGVLLYYDDGIFSASVSEQRGQLDWGGLAAGGASGDVEGVEVVRYAEPNGNAVVWEGDGVVYAAVSDAPSDVLDQLITGFAGGGRSVPQSVVDYVLDPFAWG